MENICGKIVSVQGDYAIFRSPCGKLVWKRIK